MQTEDFILKKNLIYNFKKNYFFFSLNRYDIFTNFGCLSINNKIIIEKI